MGGQVPGMMPPQGMGGASGMGSSSVGGGVPGPSNPGTQMGFSSPSPAYGDSIPLGPGSSGGMGPMAAQTPGKQVPGAGMPSPALSGTGQSMGPVTGNGTGNPLGQAQPPNAVTNQVPQVFPRSGAQAMGGPVQPPMPPQAPPQAPPPPQPPQPNQGQQNKMTVHNPTGIGTQHASTMAAAKRPAPGNYPKKAQGAMPPSPMPIPGKS